MQIATVSPTVSSTTQPRNAAQGETFAAAYSTMAAGKNYSADVEKSGGTYEASVPNMPGASASGASVQTAENNLDAIIDMMV